MTPEFPRAPINKPLDKHFANSPTCSLAESLTAFAPEVIVKFILVPVSPSGTGKTFKELTYSAFACNRVAPACTISWN